MTQLEAIAKIRELLKFSATDGTQVTGWDFVKEKAKLALSVEDGGIVDYKIISTMLDAGNEVSADDWKKFVTPAMSFKYPSTSKRQTYSTIKRFDEELQKEVEEVVPQGYEEIDVVPADNEIADLADIIIVLRESVKPKE